jgi:hypothetical protein
MMAIEYADVDDALDGMKYGLALQMVRTALTLWPHYSARIKPTTLYIQLQSS